MPALIGRRLGGGRVSRCAAYRKRIFAAPEGNDPQLVDRQRNFYGVVSVWEVDRNDPVKDCLRMQHGAILHGQQFLAAEKRGKMYNYYTPDSGISLAIRALQAARTVAARGRGRPGDRHAGRFRAARRPLYVL